MKWERKLWGLASINCSSLSRNTPVQLCSSMSLTLTKMGPSVKLNLESCSVQPTLDNSKVRISERCLLIIFSHTFLKAKWRSKNLLASSKYRMRTLLLRKKAIFLIKHLLKMIWIFSRRNLLQKIIKTIALKCPSMQSPCLHKRSLLAKRNSKEGTWVPTTNLSQYLRWRKNNQTTSRTKSVIATIYILIQWDTTVKENLSLLNTKFSKNLKCFWKKMESTMTSRTQE